RRDDIFQANLLAGQDAPRSSVDSRSVRKHRMAKPLIDDLSVSNVLVDHRRRDSDKGYSQGRNQGFDPGLGEDRRQLWTRKFEDAKTLESTTKLKQEACLESAGNSESDVHPMTAAVCFPAPKVLMRWSLTAGAIKHRVTTKTRVSTRTREQ